MARLTGSTVEDAALAWLEALGDAVLHELLAHLAYHGPSVPVAYWWLASGLRARRRHPTDARLR